MKLTDDCKRTTRLRDVMTESHRASWFIERTGEWLGGRFVRPQFLDQFMQRPTRMLSDDRVWIFTKLF